MVHFLLIGGALTSANLGINALTLGAIRCLGTAFGDAEFTVLNLNLTPSAEESGLQRNVDGFPCRQVGTDNRRALLHAVSSLVSRGTDRYLSEVYGQCDVVIDLCEGDGFGDTYGLRVFARYAVFKFLAFREQKPLIVFPQTVGPFEHPLTRIAARHLFRRAEFVFVRERKSYDIVAELLGSTEKLGLQSDMAFLMAPERFPRPVPISNTRPLVGLNASGYLLKKAQEPGAQWDYVAFMARLAESFQDWGASVVLVPHVLDPRGKEDDRLACQAVFDALADTQHVHLLTGTYTAPQIKGLIGQCDFFVGARMHACIAALSMGVPLVPIAYSHKAAGILSQFALEDWVANPDTQDDEALLALFRDGYRRREEIKTSIDKHLPQVDQNAYVVGERTRQALSDYGRGRS